jgi:hypothetical protein
VIEIYNATLRYGNPAALRIEFIFRMDTPHGENNG